MEIVYLDSQDLHMSQPNLEKKLEKNCSSLCDSVIINSYLQLMWCTKIKLLGILTSAAFTFCLIKVNCFLFRAITTYVSSPVKQVTHKL